MLNDFVAGALTCDRAKAIVPATAALLDAARKAGLAYLKTCYGAEAYSNKEIIAAL